MNIFYLDPDPRIAAHYHCDKHVVKMILETAQILSTNARLVGFPYGYETTHPNHPCVRWARHSTKTWLWTQELGISLCREYEFRWGRQHKLKDLILYAPIPICTFINTPPIVAQCMPDEFKVIDDPVTAYRNYYMLSKTHLLTYTRRELPPWLATLGIGVSK